MSYNPHTPLFSKNATTYSVLGTMSGTSCDGLDMVFAVFTKHCHRWSFHIEQATTFSYDDAWTEKLRSSDKLAASDLMELDMRLGHFMGQEIRHFMDMYFLKPDFIASHGHTVFHRPPVYTTQIGNGCAIHAETHTPVVCDFRSLDVALGGQGAPLVPIGDKLLFYEYPVCLNLGGFANLSFDNEQMKRIAFDVGAVNMILNHYSELLGFPYDNGGELARRGDIHENLLHDLNTLPYYSRPYPKSLGKEWVQSELVPVLQRHQSKPETILRTYTEHIALQIAKSIAHLPSGKVLVTGGGAHNKFLLERLSALSQHSIVVPEKDIINFKEALIFAFLGVLRMRNETNCLSSVTGAIQDCCSGTLIG